MEENPTFFSERSVEASQFVVRVQRDSLCHLPNRRYDRT
jgi:hypothetical protein